MIIGQRFNTDKIGEMSATEFAYTVILSEDTDAFLMLVPKIDIDVMNGFTFEQADYYVTTCVDPRMIGVVLGAFSSAQDETGHWGFAYQNLLPDNDHVHNDEGIEE